MIGWVGGWLSGWVGEGAGQTTKEKLRTGQTLRSLLCEAEEVFAKRAHPVR